MKKPTTLFALAALILVGCDESPTDPALVASIEVAGPEVMNLDQSIQAEASVFDGDGNVLTDVPVEWSTSNAAVADVGPSGIIAGVGLGNATITASAGSVSSSFEVRVREDPCAQVAGTLAIPDTVEGELTVESCFLTAWFHDQWLLDLDQAMEIRIDLTSEDFDSVLILSDDLLNELAFDESPGDATISATLEPGSYIVWASTLEAEVTGTYELSIREEDSDGASLRSSVTPDSGGSARILPRGSSGEPRR